MASRIGTMRVRRAARRFNAGLVERVLRTHDMIPAGGRTTPEGLASLAGDFNPRRRPIPGNAPIPDAALISAAR